MIHVKLEVTASIEREELGDYIRPLEFTVIASDMDDDLEVGKIAGELLMFGHAQEDGEDLHRVCDNDSMGMCEMHRILFTQRDVLRKFVRDPAADRVALLYRAVLSDKLRPYLQAIFELIAGMLGEGCILTMWTRVSDLTEQEWTACGFEEEHELLFRRFVTETPFALEHMGGIKVADDFAVTETDSEQVLAKWNASDPVSKMEKAPKPSADV